jgi:hypothetical protein
MAFIFFCMRHTQDLDGEEGPDPLIIGVDL